MALGLDKSRGEVTYFDEIVKELSEEFNIDQKEMKEICTLSLDYVKDLTKDKKTLAILLPYLGILYFSRSLGRFFKTLYKEDSEKMAEERSNLVYRLDKIDKGGSKIHRKKPLLYNFRRILKTKGYDLPRTGVTLGQREFWSTVSKMQNEINNE